MVLAIWPTKLVTISNNSASMYLTRVSTISRKLTAQLTSATRLPKTLLCRLRIVSNIHSAPITFLRCKSSNGVRMTQTIWPVRKRGRPPSSRVRLTTICCLSRAKAKLQDSRCIGQTISGEPSTPLYFLQSPLPVFFMYGAEAKSLCQRS